MKLTLCDRILKTATAVFLMGAVGLTAWSIAAPSESTRDELAATQVSLENGTLSTNSKAIEDVRVGDIVCAFNERTAQFEEREVTALMRSRADHLRILHLKATSGKEQRVQTTDEHPFYVVGEGWKEARELRAGDKLLTIAGRDVYVRKSHREEHPNGIDVYNFEVKGLHDYFVAATSSDDAVLSHNKCRRVNGNRRLARRPQHGYVIRRNGKVHKYGVSGGKVRKDGKSYRAERQVRKLNDNKAGDVYESEIIKNEPNRARILAWEQDMVNQYATANKGAGPVGNIRPKPKLQP